MRHLLLILIGLVIAGGGGYFIGYDHGFDGAAAAQPPADTIADAATMMSRVVGRWQSTQDPKFVREIRNDGSAADFYDGTEAGKGRWMIFTKEIPDPAYTGPLDDDAVYLALSLSESEKLYFRILTADQDSLELSYIDHGVLSFTRIP